MKKILYIAALFAAFACTPAEQGDSNLDNQGDYYVFHDDFYYIDEGKFNLEPITGEYFVIVKKDNQEQVVDQLINNGFRLIDKPYVWNISNKGSYGSLEEIMNCVFFTVKGDREITSISDIVYSNNLYLTSTGERVGGSVESNTFMIKLSEEEKDIQLETLKKYAVQHSFLIMGEMSRGYFKMACTNKTSGNSVEMSNWFVEEAGFDMAQPVLAQPEIDF